MTSMQAAQRFTYATNSSTVFNGASMGSMGNGMLVMVDATLQADGSLLATRVQSMMSGGGAMGGGVLTAVSGSPASALTMVMQNGAGNGMMPSYFASGITVNLSGSTTYQVDSDGVDLSGLPFTPAFDASHIYAGQRVMPISSSGMMSGGMGGGMMGGNNGTLSASEVLLAPQGISGTAGAAIGSGATASFSMTLPSDCALTTMTGARQVTVFQQQGTVVSGTTPIAAGTSVDAFGLLFFDGGQWKMVAARIGAN